MSQNVIRINSELFNEAKNIANIENRSVPKQIEYWAKIGRIAIENPDLTFAMIHEILLGLSQTETSELEDYIFGPDKD